MKIYEAETLTAATKSRAKQYEELKKEVTALKKEFQGIVGLDNEFQGAGATAIKSFYEAQIEVADAWMELFTTQISFLEGIPASLEEADLSGNTVVEVPFLDGEVSNGINQAKSLVDQQANDLQRILNSIDDILPLDMFDQKDFNEKITLAGHRLDDTVTKVENVDRQLVEEYDVSIGQENVAVGLFRALLDATKQDGNISPMTFSQSAFKSSDVYQVKDEVAGQMKDYQTFKKEQAEARKIEQEMEELENRPWYEKAWDTTKTFTGEFTGYYDSIRASTGVDPVTGRKLSDAERIAAGAMAAAGFIPVVGWAGRAIKGGSALYKTAKGLNAANHALDAYKTTKGFSLLQKTEYGIYGLLAANGLGEAATGKDMFGNQLTEEQRQNGLLMALGIGGVAGAAKYVDHLQVKDSALINRGTITSLDKAGHGGIGDNYKYNMIENPGPLADINPGAASTFRSGKYNVEVLKQDLILYRAGKAGGGRNALGQYFTREPSTRIEGRIDLAVKAQWIDPKTGSLTGSSPLDSVYTLKIPKGTTIYEGPAGHQAGIYSGGGNQIFVSEPWKIKDLEVINEIPIK
ncbi:ribonuclease YeeF family protein [Peribacillus frigoritolerans]|uniref:ribonuclease YeeF family protein n=1 Tax=Peribacillus frigoritolerans TaxID=450367 RepID=UPI003D052F5F